MALVFSPLLSTTTLVGGRVKAPLKHNRTRYLPTIKCNISDPLGIPFPGISPPDGITQRIFTENNGSFPRENLSRAHFPPDFLWGVGTSAIQIEGDGTEGGRGPSTGDYLIGKEDGGKGVNSYYMYREDVKLLKDMGLPCYRFSISWPRILPEGTIDKINPEGIQYYHNLLDELEKNNITPMATLFHFDLPQALQDKYNGFMDRRIIKDFTDYCDLCFRTYGHRIKHWTTVNEAKVFLLYTDMCLTDEQKRDGISQYICGHHILLSHASAYRLYQEKYQRVQRGEVGKTIVTSGFEPRSSSPEDVAAAGIAFDFGMGWFFDPLCFGDYPKTMKEWVHDLPRFSNEEKRMLKQSFDFLGINYYSGTYVEAIKTGLIAQDGKTRLQFDVVQKNEKDGILIGPTAPGFFPINIYPPGLQKLLYILRDRYKNPKVYITETGCSSVPDITMSISESIATGNSIEIYQELNDDQRIKFIRDHLHVVYQAIQDNVNVQGFIVWSLMDNNEFGSYDVRFGLNFVDYHDDYKRYPKKSAQWYKNFLSIPIEPLMPIPEDKEALKPITEEKIP